MSSNTTENQLNNKLGYKYIRGKGIVIDALHLPLQVPKNVGINFIDLLDYSQLVEYYSEVPIDAIVKPNILDNTLKLDSIQDDKFDFCIANRVLQQIKNPIGAIINWLRVLKPGGILYISIPSINNRLDNKRSLISMDHLIQDFQEANDEKDIQHSIECREYWAKIQDNKEIEGEARKELDREPTIHYHTFDEKSLKNIFSYILSIKPDLFSIKECLENEINGTYEYLIVLEKNTFCEKTVQILESRNKSSNNIDCNLDVIVPVYNAYDDLVKCLYSLVKCQKDYRVILINDKSTDERIPDLFSQLKRFESSKLILLENKTNKGFVGTVNRGMKYSNSDVILLNSDTVVTQGWTGKLTDCAYSDLKISTVTPFTNNGTICSVPDFCESNELPEGFTIDSFAEFIEKISLKKYPEIPTAVGFCMYIKREVLDKVGYFDEETFGKGYGEENDFCMRVINIGYKNVLCDDTFVFHKGEASFLDNKNELTNKNLQLLAKRYPKYFPMVADFCQSNPLSDSHKAIKLREKTWDFNDKKRILYILHNLGGGTEKHVFDLIKNIQGYVFYIAQVVEKQLVITEVNNDSSIEYNFGLSEHTNITTFYSENYKKILERIISTFKIDLIHVQHLIGHTLDVFDVAQKYKIPLLFTIHDFYTVCPRINLLDKNQEYCHNCNDLKKCSNCLTETTNLPSDYINQWRNNFNDVFKKCDMIIAPSDSAIKILNKYYTNIEGKYSIVGHGHSEELFTVNDNNDFTRKEKIFHIAYIGVLALHKGREVFYELASSEEFKDKIKWSIFGTSDMQVGKGYSPAQNIHFYGKYDDFDHLRKLVHENGVDLVILPAIWPETFSYTLSEAWALKIPVLVSNLGALKERVEMNGGGWIADFKNNDNVKEIINYIIDTPSDLLEKKREVELIHLKTFQEMALEYGNMYESFIEKSKTKHEHQNVFSNNEIFSSIYMYNNKRNNLKNEKSNCDIKGTSEEASRANRVGEEKVRDLKLYERLFLCLRQNGFRYTVRRLRVYLSGIL